MAGTTARPRLIRASVSPCQSDHNGGGILGGVHIGYNYQVSQFVFGLEGDVNGSSQSASGIDPFDYAGLVDYGIRKNIDASIRGRIGYAFDRVLIYATGGGAYGNFHTNLFDNFGDIDELQPRPHRLDGRRRPRICHRQQLVGSRGISLHRLRSHHRLCVSLRRVILSRQHVRDNRVQAGFSYKFDMFAPPAPIVSKY